MNKYFFLSAFLAISLCFSACSDNSISESETETFSNEITTETVVSSDDAEGSKADNGANTEEAYDMITIVSDTVTSQEITESETASDDTKSRFNPFAGDINEYSGKEVSFAVFYFISRYPLFIEETGNNFSVLYVFSDGTCRAEVYTNKDYFMHYCDRFSFDEISDPMIKLSQELEALDSDTAKDINSLIGQIDFKSEYTDHCPDSRNPDIEQPAVDPDYDVADFFAADKDGNLHRIMYDYVVPNHYEELGYEPVEIELDDENAKQAYKTLLNSYAVKYWLENYAWKIGE